MMQALYLADGRLTYHTDYPKPIPTEGQALIRITLAGICATDLEIVRGYANFEGVLGHEFVGVVEQADSDPAWIGKRVVGGINLGCGVCEVCLADGPEHCPVRTVLGIINHDGVFADYITLPVRNLVAVPDGLGDEVAVFTEPLAAAVRIREQVSLSPEMKAAVVGPGRLGMLAGLVLVEAGLNVTMLGRREASLALPAKLGLGTGLVGEAQDNAFDLVVEATGNEAGLVHSLRLVRPLGTLVMKSTFAGQTTVDLTKLVVGEINVVGSRCGPFDAAVRLLAENKIAPQVMIEAEYPLKDGLEAFEYADRPGVRKILLRP
jgi:threonine dehydrogenase-like Zn-dependent dehydrogenase